MIDRFRCATAVLALMAGVAIHMTAQAPAPRPAQTGQNNPVTPPRRTSGGTQYPNYDQAAVERGQTLFVSTCGFCHGANAKGGETGPDLLRSVVVLDDENGDKIGQVVLNGRPDKGMPKFNMSREQISDIATFLHQRVKDAALRGTYQILNIVSGDPKAGEAYFNGAGQCTKCHSVTGDLAHIGSKYDAVTIQQKIVMPREGRRRRGAAPEPEIAPVQVTVIRPSGQTVNGKLDHIDDFTISLTDANGDYQSFVRNGDTPKVELHDPLKVHTDQLMKYTDTDIHNLTAYLVSLK